MLGGGLRSASVTLVAGPTGAGKSLLACTFAAGAPTAGQRALVLAYEESHEQVMRNARGWGQNFPDWQEAGLLHVAAFYPDAASLDEHLLEIQDLIARMSPTRLVVDSVSALARLGTRESYREFTTRLAAWCKQQDVATLITLNSIALEGALSPDEAHIAALADAIVLLRRDHGGTHHQRHLTVLKVRGSGHDEQDRTFTINAQGLQLAPPETP
jgi:circadian clock protein KaiC